MTTWIKSTYDRSKFKMNKRRISDMIGAAENANESGDCKDDEEDILYILCLLDEGKIEYALECYRNLDTIVRDYCPQWLAELSGSLINPGFYNPKDTLEATE